MGNDRGSIDRVGDCCTLMHVMVGIDCKVTNSGLDSHHALAAPLSTCHLSPHYTCSCTALLCSLTGENYQLFTVYAPVSRLASWSGAVRSCPQAVATICSGTCHVAITVQLVSGTHGNYPKHDQMINWWECRRRMPIS